jgi:protein TonB
MAKALTRVPGFDEIVFENRNKEYGAYDIRKKYHRALLISFILGMIVLCAAIIVPYFRTTILQHKGEKKEREVIALMENLERPDELEIEAPPPPPPAEAQQQIKYVAPVIVDSIKPEEEVQIMTMDESVETIQDEEVVEVVEVVHEEIEEYKPPEEVFIIVEEMPEFPGGVEGIYQFINENVQYPQVAQENQIEGNVFLKFCVTYQGKIDQISVVRGVDPSLDAEAIRLVSILPQWTPGRQAGNPVNVWYQLRIQFKLLNK